MQAPMPRQGGVMGARSGASWAADESSFALAAAMSKLLGASGPADVVRAAASFASEQLGAPVAGWLDTTADTRSSLVAAHGFDVDASRHLRRSMRLVRRWSWLSEGQRREVRRKFAEIACVPAATAVDSGQALLLLGGTEQPLRRWTRPLKSILADSLGYSQTVTTARRREAQLDMGLAWTAHELRGPLLTARMAMDLAMEGQRPGENDLALAARQQLDSLAGLVDDLLHWSVGARPTRRTRVSLVRLVREAVDEVTTGVVNDRVRVRTTDRPLVAGDSDLLRGAVGNLVRN